MFNKFTYFINKTIEDMIFCARDEAGRCDNYISGVTRQNLTTIDQSYYCL